jgi:hypothetical protein
MTRFVLLAMCLALPHAGAQEPKAEAKAKIEIKWLSANPANGVTQEKGIQTTCGPELLYPHLAPLLTNADLASAKFNEHDWTKSGLGRMYSVDFTLKAESRKKVAAGLGDQQNGQLAIFIDGHYWGTGIVRAGKIDEYQPFAGLMSNRADAERAAGALK